jgi:FkbM family methyltransferase
VSSEPPLQRAAVKAQRRKLKLLSGFAPDDVPPAILPLDYEPHEIQLYVTSQVERRTRTKSCAKEPWTVRWIEQRVRPGDTMYDIGANVGAYSLIAAHHTGPTGRVVAIEPSYSTFAHLCDNIILNELSDVIIPVPISVGAASTRTRFHYNSLTPGHARHSLSDEPPAMRDARKVRASLHTLAMSLDDLVRLFDLPLPSYMKVDVDGTELDVLRGAEAVLAAATLRSVLIEVENINTEEMLALLARYGFAISERYQRTAADDTPADWWFGIFTRGDNPPPGDDAREGGA